MPPPAARHPSAFDTVLVANRGEIAVRVIRALRDAGLRSVAVYSDADAGARHVREADVAVRLGPAAARESYLAIDRVIAAARDTGAQAVHPGYGFLAESPAFARACDAAGIIFIGPPADAVAAMGDKIRAKRLVAAAGVPVVPGRAEPGMTDEDLVTAAEEVGYPVLIKPSAGGGGKGMRLVADPALLRPELAAARREAAAAFGDDTLFLERFVARPRHIEVQILADGHGAVVHLGERECSLQRRHQKIVEEAPSVLLDAPSRGRIGAAAVEVARAVGYVGAGTVEFVVGGDDPERFFFMEMNTRLQVEHPVTELVTGIDLVAEQLRVAAGEPLGYTQDEVRLSGHAVEARVYAEDPASGFLPTGGRALVVREPTGRRHVRVDSGLLAGTAVATAYDPMLAKVIAWGEDRSEALRRLRAALSDVAVLGVGTNVAFVRALLAHPDVAAGRLDTGLVERELDTLVEHAVPDETYAAYGLARLLALQPAGTRVDPWSVPSGWRPTGPAALGWHVTSPGGDRVEVTVRGTPAAAAVAVGTGDPVPAAVTGDGEDLLITYAGRTRRWCHAEDGPVLWLGVEGAAWALTDVVAGPRGGAADAVAAEVASPMPGTVIAVLAAPGDRVQARAPLIVVEAMKMEHTLTAPHDGYVKDLAVRAGDQVTLGQPLAVVAPLTEEARGAHDA